MALNSVAHVRAFTPRRYRGRIGGSLLAKPVKPVTLCGAPATSRDWTAASARSYVLTGRWTECGACADRVVGAHLG